MATKISKFLRNVKLENKDLTLICNLKKAHEFKYYLSDMTSCSWNHTAKNYFAQKSNYSPSPTCQSACIINKLCVTVLILIMSRTKEEITAVQV